MIRLQQHSSAHKASLRAMIYFPRHSMIPNCGLSQHFSRQILWRQFFKSLSARVENAFEFLSFLFLKNPPFIAVRNSLPPRHLSSNAIKRFFLAFLHISWANGENPLFGVGRIFLNALIASICKKAEEKLEMIFYFFV